MLEPDPLDEEPFDASAFLAEPPFLLESPEFVVDPDFSDPDFSDPPELLEPPSEDDDEPPESPLLLFAPVPLLDADAETVLGSLPRESLR